MVNTIFMIFHNSVKFVGKIKVVGKLLHSGTEICQTIMLVCDDGLNTWFYQHAARIELPGERDRCVVAALLITLKVTEYAET